MNRSDLATAIAGVARVMAADHKAHAELTPAFLLLTESLVEVVSPARPRKENRLRRLVELESALDGVQPKERAERVRHAMGIKLSYYYQLRAAAVEQGLLIPVIPRK